MNQALARDPLKAAGLKFYPFCTSALSTSVVCNGSMADPSTIELYGNIIDRQSFSGYGSLSVIMGARTLITGSSDQSDISGHFVTDTSSAFGGSTTLGSTFTLTIYASSGGCTGEGVFVATVDLNDSGAYRYVRFLCDVHPSSGDGDYMTVCPVYVLGGAVASPSTFNVQLGDQSSAIAS